MSDGERFMIASGVPAENGFRKRSRLDNSVRRQELSDEKGDNRTNDEIHKTIKFCPVVKAFVDTPQFQRLRYIKQLATSNTVYMCSNHTRFEHSLGVAFLAERIMKRIKENQPALECSPKDVLCVKLAGLLHDIGHGPFSHTYEDFAKKRFPKYFKSLSCSEKVRYDDLPEIPEDFGHEDLSLKLIDSALEYLGLKINLNKLDEPLEEIGEDGIRALSLRSFGPDEKVLTSRDFVFIKECIWGRPIPCIQNLTGISGFVGRQGWKKEWMYDVVNNSHSGLDVDKVDYFARDARRCFGDGRVDEVIVEEAVVAWGDCTHKDGFCELCRQNDGRPYNGKHLMICYPEKMVKAAINFFNERFKLHATVYTHKTTAAAAHMVCDILCLADPYFRISTARFDQRIISVKPKKPFDELPPSRAMLDEWAFMRLRDSIIEEIANSDDEKMWRARQLANRFLIRDLYKCAGERTIDFQKLGDRELWKIPEEDIKRGLLKGFHDSGNGKKLLLDADDIIVDKNVLHHGQGDQNPVDSIRVVPSTMLRRLKASPTRLPVANCVEKVNYRAQTPIEQQQCKIRVFCRDKSKRDLLSHTFQQWIENALNGFKRTDSEAKVPAISQEQASPGSGSSDIEYLCGSDIDGPPQIFEINSP